jgi:23S rRNA pseudouridine1911/1915/1917 synthase
MEKFESADREVKVFSIPPDLAGERIDLAIGRFLGMSRSQISTLLENQEIKIAVTGGKSLENFLPPKSYKVKGGEIVEVLLPAERDTTRIAPTPFLNESGENALPIVFEDENIIVVNKPVGVAAHASVSWKGPTVIGALVASGVRIETGGIAERQGVVHRLDVGTTGLMVVAKTEIAYSNLKDQFRTRTVDKTYWALVQGHMDPSDGTIDAPIDRHPKADYRFAVVSNGKPSVTHYRSLEFFPGLTYVEVKLETGRTHQIRVHFSALSHPLVGDNIYGCDAKWSEKFNIYHPWLHAGALSFIHPTTGMRVEFNAPLPSDLARSLETLRAS